MCECGCTSGNKTFTLPGPKGAVYVISFQPACVDCDGPDAVIIQRWNSRKELEHIVGERLPELPMLQCPHGWEEATIITGRTKSEFIAALKSNLVGLDTYDFMDDGEPLDDIAAEELLDEMYSDATFTPRLPGG